MKPLGDRLALVTGASRGIGAAAAIALAEAGAHMVLTARTEGGLTEVESRIHERGGTATIAPLDLADSAQIDRLAQAIGNRWGKLDLLVLNAAMLGTLSPLGHVAPAEFERLMTLNVGSNFRLIRAFDPLLRAAPAGRLIAITSGVAKQPRAYWGPYAASKAALETLIDTYAQETANVSAIRTAIVDPGSTRTAMRAQAYPGEDPQTVKAPDVVAAAIVELLTDDFKTGTRVELARKAA